MLIVVITLIIITTMIGAMLQHLTLANRQMKQRARKAQATWLAESAIERAVFALRQNENYEEEVWKVTADQLGGRHSGQVAINVESSESNPSVVVSVTAVYPESSDFRATVRKKVTVAKRKISQAAEE